MKLIHFIAEADISSKILKDPRLAKQIALAWRHDDTIPPNLLAKLGPRPTDQDIAKTFGNMVDNALANSSYGNLSRDGKSDDWMIRTYAAAVNDYEDIIGEGPDALGGWRALSTRGFLKPQDQDLNKFKNIRSIQKMLAKDEYRNQLARMKDQANIEKHKREKSETVLINDNRFLVVIPYNYGSCYTFNNAEGVRANFCTGSSSGLQWFNRYSKDGPVVGILDKNNMENKDGKWQFHAPTHQIVNAMQDNRNDVYLNDRKFAQLFPGLMKKIIAAMEDKKEEINTKSQGIAPDGYDVDSDIQQIKMKFPFSHNSNEPSTPSQPTSDTSTILREYARRISLLKEYAWWPAKKAAPTPTAASGAALVGQTARPTQPSAARPTATGESYPINQLLKIANQLKTGQGEGLLGTVDTLVSGLTKTLAQFQADAGVKQTMAATLKNIANASESGDEKTTAAEIEKLHAQFINLMKTGQYDYTVKT